MRVDRVLPTARNLWREQPRWRWTTLAAALATVAALFSGGFGGGGQPPGMGGSMPPPMPSVGSGAGTIVVPGPPVDFDVDRRLRAFYQASVDADASKAQPGLRCEKLTAALAQLVEGDENLAKPAQVSAIEEAKRCIPLIADSDQRIAGVTAALTSFKQLATLAAAQAVNAATASLTDFDTSRDLTVTGIVPAKLDELKTGVATYVSLLDRMTTLAPLYRARDPATLATAVELAKLRKDATALPFVADGAGLSSPQQQALAAGAAADEAIRASDYKIGVLQEAFTRRKADPVGLTIALGALDAFDRARLQAAQTGLNLQEAEAAARVSVGAAITRIAGDYAKSASYANASMLAQLVALAASLHADVPAEAKAVVARAEADLKGSAKRLQALNDVAARWRGLRADGKRDPGVEARVQQVMAAIMPAGSIEPNTFDAAAMTPQDRAALGTVVAAMIDIQGQLAPGQRRAVSVAVQGPKTVNDATATLLDGINTELQRMGFAVISASGGDPTFVLNVSAPSLSDSGISATGLYQRRASVTGSLQWTYSRRTADLGTITGVGANRDRALISDAALHAVAAEVAKALLGKVQGS
jgi:hypothetical protein